jgi:spermidine synthase
VSAVHGAPIDRLRRLLSWLWPQRLVRTSSAVHPYLSVRVVAGRLQLDARRVTHSGGSLREVWRQAFDALAIARHPRERVLLLGLGGGSALELLRERGVRAAVDAIELDPEVVRLARARFGIERWQPLAIHVADALVWIDQPGPRYDMVLVDLFVEDVIPPLAREEGFVRALAARLAPGGLLLFNQLGHTPAHAAAAHAFAQRAAAWLGSAWLLACHTNLVLVHGAKEDAARANEATQGASNADAATARAATT